MEARFAELKRVLSTSRYILVEMRGSLVVMRPYTEFLGKSVAAAILAISSLSACGAKVEPVKPSVEQQASFDRLYKRCGPAEATTPSKKLKHLARLRKSDIYFTCDDMKQLCETDYASERCQGMITVASIEVAVHKACRTGNKPSACSKVGACNKNGFESPECASAIKPYNR